MFGEIIFDAIIAVLAAVGLASVIWIAFDLLFEHSTKKNMFMCTFIAAGGKTCDLQNTIQSYIWRYNAPTKYHQLFIADFGMNEKDFEYAKLTSSKYKNVLLIQAEDLYYYFTLKFAEATNNGEV